MYNNTFLKRKKNKTKNRPLLNWDHLNINWNFKEFLYIFIFNQKDFTAEIGLLILNITDLLIDLYIFSNYSYTKIEMNY